MAGAKRFVRRERKKAMVRGLRAATVKALMGYRALTGLNPLQMAEALGWPLGVYDDLATGRVSPSAGQQGDIRRLLRSAISRSVPADIHYRSCRGQAEDEQRNDQLTPAWIDAMRIWGESGGGGGGVHFE